MTKINFVRLAGINTVVWLEEIRILGFNPCLRAARRYPGCAGVLPAISFVFHPHVLGRSSSVTIFHITSLLTIVGLLAVVMMMSPSR